MNIETILERISTKTGSLNWQPSTLKIAPAVPPVCGEKQVFRHSKVFLKLYNVIMWYHIKHYFGTTCTLAHSTVPVKEQIKKGHLSVRLGIERLMPVRDSPPAQSLLHTLSTVYYWFNLSKEEIVPTLLKIFWRGHKASKKKKKKKLEKNIC